MNTTTHSLVALSLCILATFTAACSASVIPMHRTTVVDSRNESSGFADHEDRTTSRR
jgi:hypothetical protein